MYYFFHFLDQALGLLWFLVIAHIIMSWLINFQVLNINQQLVLQAWSGLNRILAPIYTPLRALVSRIIPRFSVFDITPLVVILFIVLLKDFVSRGAIAYS